MNVRNLYRFAVWGAAIFLIAFTVCVSFLYTNQQNLISSSVNRFDSYLLADELRHSSDDLTRLVRTFAVTGNKHFKDQFHSVLAIRNGVQPRPENYEKIYWDFVSANARLPAQEGKERSLHELMIDKGIVDKELNFLHKAQAQSDTLVKLEETAMRAISDRLNSADEHLRRNGETNREMSIRLLHGAEYHKAKASIMKPIQAFLVNVDKRTQAKFQYYAKKTNLLGILSVFLILTVFLFGLIATLSRRKMNLHNEIYLESQITDRTRKLEDAWRSSEQQAEKMTELKELAEVANKARGDFLANMSHEIRTPMNAIIGLSHLAIKTDLTKQQQDYLQKIRSSSNNLLGIINDILDFSKIEAGKLEIERVDLNINEILDCLSDVTVLKAEEKGLEVVFSCPQEVPSNLIGDPLRLGQVLTNLISNATKFTEAGEIVITVELEKKTESSVVLYFEVRDTGIGLTKEEISKLFKSFSQADTATTRKYGGTGLGLTISKQLVELMGGTIGARSVPGKGSTFFFNAEFGLSSNVAAPHRLPDIGLRGKWVLVVDDNQMSRQILTEYLTAMSFKVCSVNSGKAALEELERVEIEPDAEPYDLVLMDWKMPKMNGIEASYKIKTNKQLSQIPTIIMVTAFGREEVMKQADDIGLDGFMLKPFNESILFDTIMNALGRRQSEIVKTTGLESKNDVNFDNIRGSRILLAEDNEINQQVALELLEGDGFVVTIVNDGQEAVNVVKDNPGEFELVLMDIQMPVMDGYAATAAIRQDARFKDLPILAMTAHAMVGEKEKSISKGLNDHITKPIDPQALNEALLRWITPNDMTGETPKQSIAAEPAPTAKPKIENNFLPDELPPFDIQAALGRLNGKKKLLRKLLIKFHDAYCDLIPTLKGMLERGEYEDAQRLAHTLRGAAGNLEAKNVFEASKSIEVALKEGRRDDIPELLITLEIANNEAVEATASLKESNPARQKNQPNIPIDDENPELASLVVLIEELDELLTKRSMKVRQKFNEFQRIISQRDANLYLDDVAVAIEKLDFEQAKIPLAALLENLAASEESIT